MKKRRISIVRIIKSSLLSAAAAFSCAAAVREPVGAPQLSAYCSDAEEPLKSIYIDILYYDIYSDHVEVSSCNRLTEGNVTVPETVEGLPVTAIAESAFGLCTKVTSVTLPETITDIGIGSFQHCYELVSINIPDSVRKIGQRAFLKCYKLREVNIPQGVEAIEAMCFFQCTGLERADIPQGVTNIGSEAFAGCAKLTYAHIPESVKSIGWCAFARCSGISEVTVFDTVETIKDDAFSDTAWYDSLPDGMIYLGKVLYKYKGLAPEGVAVRLREDTVSIGGGAFANCPGLIGVVLPEGLRQIDNIAFSGCVNLEEIELPSTLEIIGEGAFANCGLTHVEIPKSVENICSEAFAYNEKLEKIELADSSVRVECRAFHDTAWFENQPEGLVYLGDLAYVYKGVLPENSVIALKNGTKGIVESAFYGQTGLAGINIPGTVKYIGTAAFSCCSSLTEVKIPEGTVSIGKGGFSSCTNLESITIMNPDCEIYDSQYTICNEKTKSGESFFNGTIHGRANSTQKAYAEEYGYRFEIIEENYLPGDANCDGTVDIADATAILQFVGNADKYPLSLQGEINADVCGNDGVTALDSLVVQQVDAGLAKQESLPLSAPLDI